MDNTSPYQPLRPSSEGPHPLRPYYRPPSIGNPPSPNLPNATSSTGASLGAGAGNILSGFSYDDVVGDTSSWTGGIGIKALLDDAIWKYSSVFMAQPFEVAKVVLQVRLNEALDDKAAAQSTDSYSRASSSRHKDYQSDSSDSDSPSYFTSAAASQFPQSPEKRRRSHRSHTTSSTRDPPATHPSHRLFLKKSDSLTEVLSQSWTREGAWGIWKGTNVTFLYSLLFKTLEVWTRSTLAAILNLPDPGIGASSNGALTGIGGLDIIDSPSPLSSLSIAIAAAGIAGALLSPLDTIRTRLMLTPTQSTTRSIIPCLRDLKSWSCPPLILPTTLLHSTLPSMFSTTTPLLLRNLAGIDPLITPAAYSIVTFASATAELFVRLPVETVLRRGQMRVILESDVERRANEAQARSASRGRSGRRYRSESYDDEVDDASDQDLETVVEIGPYTGLIASLWRISRDEGERIEGPAVAAAHVRPGVRKKRRGQGVQGLWRGWRVGWWALVGVWGASALNGGGKGGEF